MKLLRASMAGYRRFADRMDVRLSEPLIALVGPNEAGKTSFLDALRLLGTSMGTGSPMRTSTHQTIAGAALNIDGFTSNGTLVRSRTARLSTSTSRVKTVRNTLSRSGCSDGSVPGGEIGP